MNYETAFYKLDKSLLLVEGPTTACLFSHLVDTYNFFERKEMLEDGAFYQSGPTIEQHTGIKRGPRDKAINRLVAMHFLVTNTGTVTGGTTRTVWYTIDEDSVKFWLDNHKFADLITGNKDKFFEEKAAKQRAMRKATTSKYKALFADRKAKRALKDLLPVASVNNKHMQMSNIDKCKCQEMTLYKETINEETTIKETTKQLTSKTSLQVSESQEVQNAINAVTGNHYPMTERDEAMIKGFIESAGYEFTSPLEHTLEVVADRAADWKRTQRTNNGGVDYFAASYCFKDYDAGHMYNEDGTHKVIEAVTSDIPTFPKYVATESDNDLLRSMGMSVLIS